MSDAFVTEYMAEQISSGNTSHVGIVEAAQKEIDDLDGKIRAVEHLRTRQNNLRSVIRSLGMANEIKRAKRAPMVLPSSIDFDSMDSYMQELCKKICNIVEESGKATPRQIMDSVGDLSEHKAVYAGIKWLLEQDIIQRNEDGINREITAGNNWANRP